MLQVNLEGFLGQQMCGDGVTAESIEDQNIKFLELAGGGFALQAEPRIAERHVRRGFRILHISEECAGSVRERNYSRINFVESKIISRTAVSGESSDAEADDSNAHRARLANEKFADAAVGTVVAGGNQREPRINKLHAMVGHPVPKIIVGAQWTCLAHDRNHPVEIARTQPHVFRLQVGIREQSKSEHCQSDQRSSPGDEWTAGCHALW